MTPLPHPRAATGDGPAPVGSAGPLDDAVALSAQLEDRLRRSEQALLVGEERYRSVVAAMEEGILVLDRDGVITDCNASAARMLGLEAAELVGRPADDAHWQWVRRDGSNAPFTEHPALLTLAHGTPMTGVLTGLLRDHQVRWLSVNAQPLPGHDGLGPDGAVVSFTDITERLEADRVKDEFVSVVSHELRTPLTSIRGALGLLAGGGLAELSDRAQRMLEIAIANTDRLVRLINDILDIERLESAESPLSRATVDLAELVQVAVDGVAGMAEQAGVQIEAQPLPVTVWADPDRIVQTLTNLLSNAVKFSPAGGLIRLEASRADGELLVRVSDDGRGVPPDQLESIFGRFQQVDASDSRQKGGTGLGLAICRSIVEQHGGRIWAESRPGAGATFCFTLPEAEVRTADEECAGAPPQPEREPRVATVVVCDDDPTMRAEVTDLLTPRGYRVIPVASGTEAVAACRRERPDLVLLDLQMPDLDGWSVAAALKANAATMNLPVVIFSGTPRTPIRPANDNVVGWMGKPLVADPFVRALERAMTERPRMTRVLVVEDDPDLASVLVEVFRRQGVPATCAATTAGAIALLGQERPDAVILDLRLPDGDGEAVLSWMRGVDHLRSVPVFVYTARDLDDEALRRLRTGPTEVLSKAATRPAAISQRVADLVARLVPTTGQVAR